MSWRRIKSAAMVLVTLASVPVLRAVSPVAQNSQEPQPTAEFFLKQGNSFVKAGEWKQAIAAYRRALELDPKSLPAHYGLADAYGAERKFPEAIREYKAVLAAKPGFPGIHAKLGAL